MSDTTLYNFSARRLDGREVQLSDYEGKVVLVVNTASKCGLTPHYKGLQALHEKFGERGLAVLGFPCNQFGAQEPGSSDDISSFCQINYGVSFDMFEKIEVNGAGTHPLYQWLKKESPGFLGSEGIKWNFTKFLLSKTGEVVGRYAPTTKPEAIEADIEQQLTTTA